VSGRALGAGFLTVLPRTGEHGDGQDQEETEQELAHSELLGARGKYSFIL